MLPAGGSSYVKGRGHSELQGAICLEGVLSVVVERQGRINSRGESSMLLAGGSSDVKGQGLSQT